MVTILSIVMRSMDSLAMIVHQGVSVYKHASKTPQVRQHSTLYSTILSRVTPQLYLAKSFRVFSKFVC